MADWKAQIRDSYYGLSARDRTVVNWGTPIILLLIIYLLVGRPLLDGYLRAVGAHDQLRSDLVWLLDQSDYLQRINSSCPLAIDPLADTDVEFVVTGQARRLGLNPQITAAGVDSYNLRLTGAAGNAVLTLTRELACRGLAVTSLEINLNAAENALVDARLGLQRL